MKLKTYFYILAAGWCLPLAAVQAQPVTGRVIERDSGKAEPLPGAVVHIAGTSDAVTTDPDGNFSLEVPGPGAKLVTSFIGHSNDTTDVAAGAKVTIVLKRNVELKEATVTGHQSSLGVSRINPMNTERITEREILKAACCNLSESFETNPTVNVAYTDAVTGAKEIRMLGLSGIYTQLLTENIPNMRGIAGIYGLTFIPGPWMESIQVTKGSGSVLNGYESTTGQLNVEFKKPQEVSTPKFYLNLFGEANTNAEVNTWYKRTMGKGWSTVLMAHGNYMNRSIDRNGDGFHDMPHNKQINLYSRWQYQRPDQKLESQIGLKFLADKRHGGQLHDGPDDAVDHHSVYIADVLNRRYEAFGKLGILFPSRPGRSIGNIGTYQRHELQSTIGLKHYDATQQTALYQGIFQDYIVAGIHEYKTGVSFQYDRLDETYNGIQSLRTRYIPGAFMEYTFSPGDKFKAVLGAREDYNSKYHWIFTPRMHLRYSFSELTILRFSAGKSFREPYLIAENISLLASSKSLVTEGALKPERAWNYGFNFLKGIVMGEKELTINVDLYRTQFIHQVVVDRYSDSMSVSFYNLDGKSVANSLQISADLEVTEGLTFRLAWKGDQVKTTYRGVLEHKPLVPESRWLFNAAYATKNEHWKFDATLNRIGTQHLANSTTDPVYGKQPEKSPAYSLVNFQVTRAFKHFEVYGGSENLLDFTQENPIVAASDPFGPAFDASNIWGPIDGIRIYAGLRFSIK